MRASSRRSPRRAAQWGRGRRRRRGRMREPRSKRGGSEPSPLPLLLGSSLGKKPSRAGGEKYAKICEEEARAIASDGPRRPEPSRGIFGRPRRAHAGAPRQGGENGKIMGPKKLLGRDRRDSPGALSWAPLGGFVGAAAVTVIRIRSGLRMMLRACLFIRLISDRV